MGIAGFSTWFAQLYPTAYVPLKGMSTDHLYIDIAGILHTITRRGEPVSTMPNAGSLKYTACSALAVS